jgi:hypothetical protein
MARGVFIASLPKPPCITTLRSLHHLSPGPLNLFYFTNLAPMNISDRMTHKSVLFFLLKFFTRHSLKKNLSHDTSWCTLESHFSWQDDYVETAISLFVHWLTIGHLDWSSEGYKIISQLPRLDVLQAPTTSVLGESNASGLVGTCFDVHMPT